MKRRSDILAAVLCLALLAGMTAGCGSSSEEPKEIAPAAEEAGEETGAEEAAGEEAPEEEAAGEEAPAEEAEAPSEKASGVTIEEQVLVDQDGVKITATDYVTDSIWGDGIKLLIENNTDRNLTIGCEAMIVNDYMVTDLFACDVAAGKKANETAYLLSSELKAAGIENVGKIELYLHAFDSDWEDVFRGAYAEIRTSAYEDMDTAADDSGMELYNEGGIRIVGKTVDEDSFWGTAVLLYCENTSGRNVTISVSNMSVNGFMIDPFFSSTVYDGKKSFDEITLMSSELEDNGITSIEEIELSFTIYDEASFETIAESGPITFTAK